MTPLIPDMPKLPTLSEKEKLKESNMDYANQRKAAEWNTESMQIESQDLLWGSFSEDQLNEVNRIKALEAADNQGWENINENQEKENQILLEKFKNHPSFPILERFMNIEVWDWKKMTLLTESDLIKVSNNLGNTDDQVSWLNSTK